jgi:hypothetical protein
MNHKTIFSSAAAAAVASLSMVLSTGALGACKATLRGELVQAPDRQKALPQKFLLFELFETTRDNGANSGGRVKSFQSFVVPNTRTTFPIPFALDIESPRDCPGELELSVGSSDMDSVQTHDLDQVLNFTFGDLPLTGRKAIHIEKFESIPVWANWRRF